MLGLDRPVFGAFYYGERGALEHSADGRKVRCHACGKWFKALTNTHLQGHSLTADEYRSEFGLAQMTSLSSMALTEWRSINGKTDERIARFRDVIIRAKAVANRRLGPASGRRRLETRLSLNFLDSRRAAAVAGRAERSLRSAAALLTKACVVCGGKFVVKQSRGKQSACSAKCDYKRRGGQRAAHAPREIGVPVDDA